MTMAARRANQVLATVGVFAALAAARMAVEFFPAARAADALAELVMEPPTRAPETPAPSPAGEVATKTAAAPDLEVETAPRRVPSRAGHESTRPSLRLIRTPSIPS